MEITTLSIRLLTEVLVLVAVQADRSNFADAVFPHIVPNTLQFFEYKSISLHCEEDNSITEWIVKWKSLKIENSSQTSNTSASPCTIYPTFESHSGEYWCENEDGEKSEAVNIVITAGSVILESPAYPVMEGNEVTLNCKNKKTQSEHITDFYKDGVSLGTWYQSSMTIKNVSKSNEGLYKCSISGAGESPESWLAVLKQREAHYNETDLSHEVPKISHDEFPKKQILLWTVICVLLVALLLMVMALILHKKHKDTDTTALHQATYAVVSKQRKQNDGDISYETNDVLYATVKSHWGKKEPKVSRADINPSCQEETVIYSSVKPQT
ncbi:high affinity immunoglobulin gamma Fc receptor I-like [Haplochromis burtoni]|uniref:high affinity immunoglobulin gamma Fc receptor I-like n=1 Tax=Haplochromis burtoni TaxID=8153 RepID=UPI001C2CF8AB|nr:high affinity immunoglobulin gamma Fc receptor I-like [Haplochromis burtoni]